MITFYPLLPAWLIAVVLLGSLATLAWALGRQRFRQCLSQKHWRLQIDRKLPVPLLRCQGSDLIVSEHRGIVDQARRRAEHRTAVLKQSCHLVCICQVCLQDRRFAASGCDFR